jgi:hypothetical protein
MFGKPLRQSMIKQKCMTNLDFRVSDNILLQEFITKCSRDSENTTHSPCPCKFRINQTVEITVIPHNMIDGFFLWIDSEESIPAHITKPPASSILCLSSV